MHVPLHGKIYLALSLQYCIQNCTEKRNFSYGSLCVAHITLNATGYPWCCNDGAGGSL